MTSAPPAPEPIPDRAAVLKALDRIKDPRSGRGLVEAGLVRGLALRPGRAGFMLEVEETDLDRYAGVRDAAEAALSSLKGVRQAQVVLTAETASPGGAPPGPAPRPSAPPRSGPRTPDHVRRVMAVASAKGGVGKSTVAINLAAAFAALGYRTGLLDADVYGPSVPKMLGLDQEPRVGPDKKLIPLEAFGVKAVSIGLLVKEAAPMIWRGPMASSAVTQLLQDVAWGLEDDPMDILVIDMPPGTGDVQLTLAQKVRLDGAVIVSTPQELALIDVRRGMAMFERTETPILGVVENMAYFPDPTTGAPLEIFGRGGARRVALEAGAPFLGEIPIDIALRQAGDVGRPIVADAPEGASAALFLSMAARLAQALEGETSLRPPPRIVIED